MINKYLRIKVVGTIFYFCKTLIHDKLGKSKKIPFHLNFD